MTDTRGLVIIGASLAGAKAAQTLREEGFDGRIALIGEEPVRPYERPPLSKDYLQGKVEADVAFVHDPAYYDKHDIDLRLATPVRRLEPAGREVVLASGERLGYDEQIPYFYSDQYDVGMEYSGYAPGWDQVVFRGDPAGREFIAFWVKDGRVVAGMNVNVWDVADSIAALVAAGGQVGLSRLLDPDVELATLAG